MARRLQVVAPGAKAPPETPKSITEALDGTSRDVLASMRRALAMKFDAGEVSANSLASVSTKIEELDQRIRALDAAAAEETSGSGRHGDEAFDASAI